MFSSPQRVLTELADDVMQTACCLSRLVTSPALGTCGQTPHYYFHEFAATYFVWVTVKGLVFATYGCHCACKTKINSTVVARDNTVQVFGS